MKKVLIFTLLVFIFGAKESQAQLGAKIGYNFAKVSGVDPTPSYSAKYLKGLQFGVFFDKDLIPLLDIRIGLDYSPKGYKEMNGGDYNQIKLNYLEIPVLAKVKLGPIYALGGVYGAYALNGESKIHGMGIDITKDLDFDASKLKKMDMGMKFGAGFQFGLGPIHIFAQGEYSFGIQNLSKEANTDYRNNVIGVSAGVLLGFK